MTTSISNKVAALFIALMVNGAIVGGVAAMFNDELRQVPALTLVKTTAAVYPVATVCC